MYAGVQCVSDFLINWEAGRRTGGGRKRERETGERDIRTHARPFPAAPESPPSDDSET